MKVEIDADDQLLTIDEEDETLIQMARLSDNKICILLAPADGGTASVTLTDSEFLHIIANVLLTPRK